MNWEKVIRKIEDLGRLRAVRVIAPYLLAFVLTVATTVVLYLLREVINPSIVALLFLLPVGLTTALSGLGPGIAAAFAGFLAFNYFFIQPYYTLMVHHTQDLLALLVFLIVAVVISQLVGRTRQSLAKALAREGDAICLYDFSNRLAGLHDESEILQTITSQTMDTFRAEQVEVFVDNTPGQSPSTRKQTIAGWPPEDQLLPGPAMIIPLQSAARLLGEIRIWRQDPPILPEEERLLRTFASQSVLAIERARLQQAETRARILEESDRLKTSLLSSVSHELRTPLAAIKASVSGLRSGAVDWDNPARQELLEAVDEETDHLNQLVENLLNMSRIEAGVLKPVRHWNSLEEIIASAVKRLRQPGKLISHPIESTIPEDLPLVPVDYLQMEQVFTNLISNSLKYSPEGSPIRIQACLEGEQNLLVQVSNQSPLLPEQDLARIFDKFYRPTTPERVIGIGLGLSICKGIIEAHGGQIWAENLPDGFAFNFNLPIVWEGGRPYLPEEGSTRDED